MPELLDEVQSQLELVRGEGTDGHMYVVRPISWTLQGLYDMAERFMKFKIFSDDIDLTKEWFAQYVVGTQSLWFEVYDETEDKQVGVIFLTDIQPSATDNITVHAKFHAEIWDSDIATRRDLGRKAIKQLMRLFAIHRLYAEVPMCKGGAIRNLVKLGFIEEGRQRRARRYNWEWYDVLMLSLLREEVEND